jgi:hypothetical protein
MAQNQSRDDQPPSNLISPRICCDGEVRLRKSGPATRIKRQELQQSRIATFADLMSAFSQGSE